MVIKMSDLQNEQKTLSKEERMIKGTKIWAAYYRANPQRFVKEYLKIKLHLFQQILIYMCFQVEFFMYLASIRCCLSEMVNINLVNLEI